MKAIIRQNLVHHLTEIDERKQTTQSLQTMLSGSTKGTTSNRIDELIGQIDRKQAQLYRYQQRQQQEKVRQGLNVKPSAFVKDSSERSKRKTDGRRPVDTQLPNSADVACLDLLPTAAGVDSALHSILGPMNSVGVYVSEDGKRFRKRLTDFLRKNDNVNNNTLDVKQFVLRLVNGEDFPVGSAVKKEYMKYRQQNGDESQFNWPEPSKELLDEYVQFIESPFNDLAVPEVELLAKVFDVTIHVYEDHSNWSSFKHKATINPGQPLEKQQFILHKSCGEWQRLEANHNLQQFCKELKGDLFHSNIQQTSYFSSLMNLLIQRNHQDLMALIKMLNPEDGVTPDKLSQLLMEKHFIQLPTAAEGEQNDAAIQKQLDELSPDIRLLTERVLEYNQRNWSPIFYLHVVSKCTEPHEWKYEFLLMEMEGKLTQLPGDRTVWKKEILTSLKKFNPQTVALLRECLIGAATENESDGHCLSTIEPKEISRILQMLAAEANSTEIISEHFHKLPTDDWLYDLRNQIWQRKVNELTTEGLSPEETKRLKKEAVYLLLELEYKKGADDSINGIKNLPGVVCELKKTLYPDMDSTQPIEEVSCRKIFMEVRKEDRVITKKNKFDLTALQKLVMILENQKLKQPNDNEKALEKLVKELDQRSMTQGRFNRVIQLGGTSRSQNHDKLSDEDALKTFICVYNNVIRLKMGFQLRDTQRLTIMILLNELLTGKKILAQVSTGEGKSLIVAGVAIFGALSGLNVDIVTSNDVLALRDSTLSVADGGLRDLYEFFKVGVANNCSQSQDVRAKAYNSAVVYGELANFQRDYLLHTFYALNIRGDRKMDFVIIDEVDCMLLDRGSNTLYLSHDIPGMEMLESLYVFIWERIQKSVQLDVIKSQVLYDLYGAIGKKDLETIHAPLKEKPSEQNKLWHYLIQARIIDPNGRCLIMNVEENKIDYKENPALNPKLMFFFRKVIERERHIRIPAHLLHFVDRHLDTWLVNALRAMELKQDEDYVIDQDRTDTSPDLNPQVIIIDPDTGTDQTTSQWDGALHQFLQLKEGCKLTLQSLKAVFISNEEYIKLYRKLTGVSGTLGSQTEKDYIIKTYDGCNYFTVPTALPKRFIYKMAKVLKRKESWLSSIIKEMEETVLPAKMDEARSIVIFCRTIKDVNIVHNHIKINLPQLIADNKLHRYTRDYEQFAFESKQLEIGHVIIATNLAGRGTDIKISKELLQNGGLHICMTYLPQNERITEQAMGRSGRKGAPGSGILILCQESGVTVQNGEECWNVGKYFSMKHERHQQELQRISRLQEDFKKNINHSKCLSSFITKYIDLKNQMKEKGKWDDMEVKVFCDNALDQWALWLDQIDIDSPRSFALDHEEYLKSSLIRKLELPESQSDIGSILPARSVVLATCLAQKTFGKLIPDRKHRKAEARKNSGSLLEKLAESNDAFFYPVAPYYLAFLIIKKGGGKKKENDVTKMLRSSETILNEHIRMQMSFYRKINQNLSQRNSFCSIDAYQQQKVNIANLLGHYINSIRSLLGSHYCSASDLEKAGIDGQKVDKFFEQLKTDCIAQQPKLNDDETVPNKKAAIQHVALIHNVDDPASLEENLSSVFYKVSNPTWDEKKIEKEIKKEIEISCTRKSFWKNMVKKRVLEDAIDFVIMNKSECDIHPKLDGNEKLTLDFESKDYVFFRPIPYTAEEMKKKIVFRENYVKDIIKGNDYQEYHRRKKTFEFNKMGRLNLIELKKVNETKEYEAKVDEDDLRGIHIDPDERKSILAELKNQKIIDRQGYLTPEYNGQEFRYTQCPAYEDAVMGLLGRKFAIEIVIRQWLKSEEDPELLKAIELLPLNPHRNMLADLMAAHVIAGARVKDDLTFIDLKQAIKKIGKEERTKFDKEERKCLLDYLISHQALYVPTKSPDDFSLDFIEREIRLKKGMDNISAELYIFGLVGFDQHIIYENKWSKKAISQALISTVVGGGLMVSGYYFDTYLTIIPSLFGVNFLVTGGTAFLLNGIENLLLRNKSTWADYGRQSLMNLIEKPDPFVKINTIWKLIKYWKSINQTPSPPSSFNVQEPIVTENQLATLVETTNNILHDPYRLLLVISSRKSTKLSKITWHK
jgi:preprotein translocase subunit SecA